MQVCNAKNCDFIPNYFDVVGFVGAKPHHSVMICFRAATHIASMLLWKRFAAVVELVIMKLYLFINF